VTIMTAVSIYERYVPGLNQPKVEIGASFIFVVNKNNLLVRLDGGNVVFPCLEDIDMDSVDLEGMDYIGMFDEHHCYCVNFKESMAIPDGMIFENLRTLYTMLETELSLVVGRAMHIANWSRLSKFCGACGVKTERKKDERAMQCPSCGNVIYPRISPAIIIAIVNKDKLLLAHNKSFQGKRYSVIAGFMEPGETFEDCAKREAFEEVGIQIKNIKFFGNQPWPFPDSLMIGLTAEYDCGELKPDGVEIDDAGWFSREEIPEVPGTISIAGKLIEWFSQNTVNNS
jgi:NAD+ diphosphatase